MRKLKRKWGKTERELSSNIAINPTDNLIEKNAYFNFAPLLLLRKGGGGMGCKFPLFRGSQNRLQKDSVLLLLNR